jgi:hypothetical protein
MLLQRGLQQQQQQQNLVLLVGCRRQPGAWLGCLHCCRIDRQHPGAAGDLTLTGLGKASASLLAAALQHLLLLLLLVGVSGPLLSV